MLKTELKLPFPWYNALSKQHRFRKQNISGEILPLIVPSYALLPFEIKVAAGSSISQFRLFNLDGTVAQNLSANIGHINIYDNVSRWFIYKGDALASALPFGCYYAVINSGSQIFYSEIFKVSPNSEFNNCVEVRWTSFCDIGTEDRPVVIYSTGYSNWVFLKTYVEPLQPELTEEGDENGAGDFVPSFQRLVCKQKIEAFAPDYLLDAFAFMQMHDQVFVSDYTDTEVPIKRIKVTNDYGDFAKGTTKIEFEFLDDYIKTGCCIPPEIIGEVCSIQVSDITYETSGGQTTINFVPVLHGSTLSHYQWRSTSFAGNAWQNIGTSTSFNHAFTVGQTATIEIQAICDNTIAGPIASVSVTVAVCVDVAVPDTQMPNATVGLPYNFNLSLSGTAPFTITNVFGKPAWMTIGPPVGNTIPFRGTPATGDAITGLVISLSVNNCTDSTAPYNSTIDVVVPFGCDDIISTAVWSPNTFHDYGDFYLDTTGVAHMQLSWSSVDRPNQFALINETDNITIVNTGWVGQADYPGPWGESLSTSENGTITFNPTAGKVYKLNVVAGPGPISDNWTVTIACT